MSPLLSSLGIGAGLFNTPGLNAPALNTNPGTPNLFGTPAGGGQQDVMSLLLPLVLASLSYKESAEPAAAGVAIEPSDDGDTAPLRQRDTEPEQPAVTTASFKDGALSFSDAQYERMEQANWAPDVVKEVVQEALFEVSKDQVKTTKIKNKTPKGDLQRQKRAAIQVVTGLEKPVRGGRVKSPLNNKLFEQILEDYTQATINAYSS